MAGPLAWPHVPACVCLFAPPAPPSPRLQAVLQSGDVMKQHLQSALLLALPRWHPSCPAACMALRLSPVVHCWWGRGLAEKGVGRSGKDAVLCRMLL